MDTIRQKIVEILRKENKNALDLSKLIGVKEKEVYDHLEHIKRTIAGKGDEVFLLPYESSNLSKMRLYVSTKVKAD